MSKLSIAIAGAAGRMGQKTLIEVLSDEDAACSGMLVRPGSPLEGKVVEIPDTGLGAGFYYTCDAETVFKNSDVVIDFSSVEGALDHARLAAKTGTALAVGVTGFSDDQIAGIKAAGKTAPVLLAYNMSFGIASLAKALKGLSKDLGDDFVVEITDIHHKTKKDAPSGTALMLGEVLGRAKDDLKFTSVREGAEIGEHRVLFSGPAEEIEVIHRARDRRLYAKGAMIAARWLARQGPGFYTLNDVLEG